MPEPTEHEWGDELAVATLLSAHVLRHVANGGKLYDPQKNQQLKDALSYAAVSLGNETHKELATLATRLGDDKIEEYDRLVADKLSSRFTHLYRCWLNKAISVMIRGV